jgi:hypothetical protein
MKNGIIWSIAIGFTVAFCASGQNTTHTYKFGDDSATIAADSAFAAIGAETQVKHVILAQNENAAKFVEPFVTREWPPGGAYRVGVTVRNTSRDRKIKATVTVYVKGAGEMQGREHDHVVVLEPGERKEVWGGPSEYGVVVNTRVSGARFVD